MYGGAVANYRVLERCWGILPAFRGGGEEGNSVAAPCGLHDGLRQSGSARCAQLYGTAEAVPLRFVVRVEMAPRKPCPDDAW
jgi:hypothetical protein